MRRVSGRATLVALAAVLLLAAIVLFMSRAALAPAGAPLVAATAVRVASPSATTASTAAPANPGGSEPAAAPANGTADPSATPGFRSFPYIAPTAPPPPVAVQPAPTARPRPPGSGAPAPAPPTRPPANSGPPPPRPATGPTPTARELFAACKAAVEAEAWDAALRTCEDLRRLDAKYPGLEDALAAAYVGLGEARLQERKLGEARDLCQQALAIVPDLPAAKVCQAAAGGGITEVD